MVKPHLPGFGRLGERPDDEKNSTEQLCEAIFDAISNLYLMMLPGIPPDPAVFQSCVAIRTKVRTLLVEDHKAVQSVQARLLSLGGGRKGLSQEDAYRIKCYYSIMGQAYELFHKVHPDVERSDPTEETVRWTGDGLAGFPSSSKGLDWICDEEGRYTFLRSIIHQAIVFNQCRLAKKVPDVRIPCALLMLGGFPAEGFLIREALQERHGDFMQISPTQILMQLPEFYEIFDLAADQGELDSAARFSENEVADIVSLLLQEAKNQRYNVFIEGLGGDQEGYLRIAQFLAREGYRILAVGVTEGGETAERRAKRYGKQTLITVDTQAIKEHLAHLEQNLPNLLQKAGASLLYDFDGNRPEIIWAKQGAKSKTFQADHAKIKQWSL